MQPLAEGDLIAGEYKVFQTTAGGMGAVYFCKNSKGEDFALKTYLDDEENIEQLRSRFIEEVSAWIVIGNPDYLLHFDELILHGSKPFIKMKLCKNGSLRKYIGTLTEESSIAYFIQICLGLKNLADAHSYIHLDMKPENILIDENDEILICDLGIAKIYKNNLSKKLISTAGSIPYMAPEQMTASPIDFRTDMYALGMIFYEMLTGENLFKGDTIAEIFNNKAIQNYSKKFNSLKIEHKKIIASLTEPNINKRPNSYADVLGIINKFTKVDKCFKKFPFYKKDDRIAISNSKILGYWIKNFPDQASENIHYVTLGNIKAYKDIERARNFHKLGDYNASIKYCDSTLQFGKEYTIFDQYILKSPKGDNAPDILPDNSLIDVRLIVSSSAYYVLTLLFISSVDYIEAGGNDHAVLNLVKKYTDKTLYCKDLPEEVVAVLVQVLVKTKRYAEAYPIITSLLSSKFFLVRIKCYATLAILFFETKKIDALIDLINEKIIPETEKYNSHLAHRTCGQSLIFINNFELGAYHFYNAYLLDSSDLWSLKHSIIGYLNANKVDVAKRLFKIMFEQDANNPHTKGVISIFKQAKLIN